MSIAAASICCAYDRIILAIFMRSTSQSSSVSSLFTGENTTSRGVLIFVVLVVVGLTISGWREALAGLSSIGVGKILLLCGFAGLHYIIRGLRWHMIVRTGKVATSVKQNMLHFFGGFAMTATPGRLGELVRLRWLCRDSGKSFGTLLPIVFADRAIELAAIVFLIGLALMLVNLETNAVWGLLLVSIGLVWIVCRPHLLESVITGLWRLSGKRFSRLFVKLRRMTRRLAPFMRLPILLPTIFVSVLGWALEGVAFYVLLSWLGVDISIWTAMAIFLVAVLSGALSGLPGGLGGTEATAVALLLLQGVPLDAAVLATLVIRVTTLWFAVLIGLTVFPLAEALSGKQGKRAER